MAECHQCPECGLYAPIEEWEVFGDEVDDDIEGYVDANGDFQAYAVEARARCPHCGEVSEYYI